MGVSNYVDSFGEKKKTNNVIWMNRADVTSKI